VLTTDRHDAGLELEYEEAFHQRMWRVRRVGWLGMVLLMLAGFGGFLGGGPMSRAEVRTSHGVRIEHARFARAEAPQTLQAHLPVPAADGYRLAVSREFLDRVRIDSVVPHPLRTEVHVDRVVYVFAGPSATAAAAVATFHFTPHSMGLVRAGFGVPDLATLTIWMIVYP
jgi:hypothetical protein